MSEAVLDRFIDRIEKAAPSAAAVAEASNSSMSRCGSPAAAWLPSTGLAGPSGGSGRCSANQRR